MISETWKSAVVLQSCRRPKLRWPPEIVAARRSDRLRSSELVHVWFLREPLTAAMLRTSLNSLI